LQAVTALLGGHVHALSQTTEWKAHVNAGTLRLLAVWTDQRLKVFPNVPALREKGYPFSVHSVLSLMGPAGMPKPVVEKLQSAFAQAMESKAFLDVMDKFDLPYMFPDKATVYAVTDGPIGQGLLKMLEAQGIVAHAVIVNKKWWDGLPPDIHKALEAAMAEAS